MILYHHNRNYYVQHCCKKSHLTRFLNLKELLEYINDNKECTFCGEPNTAYKKRTFQEVRSIRLKDLYSNDKTGCWGAREDLC